MELTLALIRAVNVGGRKATSADLQALMAELGFEDARTVIQSGNLVFRSPCAGAELEARIEASFAAKLGFASDVLVRNAPAWRGVIAANPYLEMAERDPAHLLVMPLKSAPDLDAVAAIQAWTPGPERLAAAGRELYICYPEGVGASKLTNAVIERRLGVRGASRNWNTALKLAAFLDAAP